MLTTSPSDSAKSWRQKSVKFKNQKSKIKTKEKASLSLSLAFSLFSKRLSEQKFNHSCLLSTILRNL
ncbi:hypothetical protein ACOSQ3_013965 [Xanthoceras sorbifolium]